MHGYSANFPSAALKYNWYKVWLTLMLFIGLDFLCVWSGPSIYGDSMGMFTWLLLNTFPCSTVHAFACSKSILPIAKYQQLEWRSVAIWAVWMNHQMLMFRFMLTNGALFPVSLIQSSHVIVTQTPHISGLISAVSGRIDMFTKIGVYMPTIQNIFILLWSHIFTRGYTCITHTTRIGALLLCNEFQKSCFATQAPCTTQVPHTTQAPPYRTLYYQLGISYSQAS